MDEKVYHLIPFLFLFFYIRCHKPFDSDRFFRKSETRCNACQTKLEKEREKRQQKRQLESREEGEDSNDTPAKKKDIDVLGQLATAAGFSGAKVAFVPIFYK